jgi:hypothetical protein
MVIRYYGKARVNVPPYTKAEEFDFYRRMAGYRPDGTRGPMVIARSDPRSAGSAAAATSPPSPAIDPAQEPAAAAASPADQPKGKGRRQPRS